MSKNKKKNSEQGKSNSSEQNKNYQYGESEKKLNNYSDKKQEQ